MASRPNHNTNTAREKGRKRENEREIDVSGTLLILDKTHPFPIRTQTPGTRTRQPFPAWGPRGEIKSTDPASAVKNKAQPIPRSLPRRDRNRERERKNHSGTNFVGPPRDSASNSALDIANPHDDPSNKKREQSGMLIITLNCLLQIILNRPRKTLVTTG